MQQRSSQGSSDRRTAVIAAVWGGIAGAILGPIITLVCNRAVDYFYPSIQRITLVGQSEAFGSVSDSSHLEKVRADAPPFIYRLRFDHHEDSYWKGLQKVPQQWIYSLDIANLTRKNQEWVQVSMKCNTPDAVAGIGANRRSDVYLSPDDSKSIDCTDITSKRSIAFIKPLDSSTSKTIVICIFSSNAPDTKDIELRVSSPDGDYVGVSNAAWDAVGWKN